MSEEEKNKQKLVVDPMHLLLPTPKAKKRGQNAMPTIIVVIQTLFKTKRMNKCIHPATETHTKYD